MRVNFRKIDQALDDIENYQSYYIGGSLCIDFKFHPNVVLNKNGRGFSYYAETKFKTKKIQDDQKFIVTSAMQKKINKIYNKYKGDKSDCSK